VSAGISVYQRSSAVCKDQSYATTKSVRISNIEQGKRAAKHRTQELNYEQIKNTSAGLPNPAGPVINPNRAITDIFPIC